MEYQYLKSFYESKVTWKQEVNHLRCSPSFNKQPRYDHVIIQTDSAIFAQLKFIFTAVVGQEHIPFILVQAFDIYHDRHYKKKDKELGFIRLRQRSEREAEFFFARSIIRGAVIFPAYDEETDYVVFDIADTDMFLRTKEIVEATNSSGV